MGSFATNYEEIVAVLLFVIGMSNLVFQPNLLKKIIGLDIMDAAVYLFLAAKGYIEGRTAPIVVDGILDASHYINPVPAGLVLTGIVVSVSVSALMMALTVCLYREYHTLNIDEIMMKLRKEEELNGICPEFSVFLHYFVHVLGNYFFCNERQNCKIHSRGHGYGSADTFPGNPFLCGRNR